MRLTGKAWKRYGDQSLGRLRRHISNARFQRGERAWHPSAQQIRIDEVGGGPVQPTCFRILLGAAQPTTGVVDENGEVIVNVPPNTSSLVISDPQGGAQAIGVTVSH